eukprot:scaffold16689_cov99-Amphora_coffeaeformis.AAC.1
MRMLLERPARPILRMKATHQFPGSMNRPKTSSLPLRIWLVGPSFWTPIPTVNNTEPELLS